MIIQIRGASGSGKSTIVKSILEMDPHRHPHHLGGDDKLDELVPAHLIVSRAKPIGYVVNVDDFLKPVYILGHYETPAGGCDTLIPFGKNWVYKFAENLHDAGYDVIMEGMILSGNRDSSSDLLTRGVPYVNIGLNLSFEECVRSVQERRARRGPMITSVGRLSHPE